MRKRFLAGVLCTTMAVMMCACNTVSKKNDTIPTPQPVETQTPEATVTPTETEKIPITDYEECVATTTLPENYIGIEVTKVTDEEVEAYIKEVLEKYPALEEKEGTVENGDIVNLDYVGTSEGEEFDAGTMDLEVGSGQTIDGFEDGLLGAAIGETRVLELKFPDPYTVNTDLSGKDAIFEVKVNSISRYVVQEFTDEAINEITGGEYTTTEDFREYAFSLLTEEREYTAVMDYMVENTTFGELNEAYIEASLNSMKDYYGYYAAIYGMDIDTFMQYQGVTDADAFWAEMKEEMRRAEQERIVLYCIAKAENITITEEEFTASATSLAESYSMTLEEFLEAQDETYVRQSILMERALEYLLHNIVEK